MRKTNEMMKGTDKRNYEADWETKDMLDLLDSTMEEAVPIPKELFERMDETRAKAAMNIKREKIEAASKAYAQAKEDGSIKILIPERDKSVVAKANPTDITLEQAFAVVFERYEGALKELSEK